jgi:hypothetical protein
MAVSFMIDSLPKKKYPKNFGPARQKKSELLRQAKWDMPCLSGEAGDGNL